MRIEITLALIAVGGTLVGAALGAVSPWWVQRGTEERHGGAAERVARRVVANELNLIAAALTAATQTGTMPRDPSVLPSHAWSDHQDTLAKREESLSVLGECLALRWRDVDFERQALRVEHSITVGRKAKSTKSGQRSRPLA